MASTTGADATSDRDLVLTRIIDAPRDKVFKAWTEPELLTQWFAPLPWTTPHAELDLRPGGACLIVMRSPDGDDMPNRGSISKWSRTNGWSPPMLTRRHGSRPTNRS